MTDFVVCFRRGFHLQCGKIIRISPEIHDILKRVKYLSPEERDELIQKLNENEKS